MYHCFQHKHGCVSSVKSRQSSLSGMKLFTGIQADYLTIPDIDNRLKKKKKGLHFKIQSLVCPFQRRLQAPQTDQNMGRTYQHQRPTSPQIRVLQKNQVACRMRATPHLRYGLASSKQSTQRYSTNFICSTPKRIYCWSLPRAKYMVQLPGTKDFGEKNPLIPSTPLQLLPLFWILKLFSQG